MAYQDKVKYSLQRDAALNDISSHIDFGVRKGPSQLTSQQFLANSSSASQLSWNITPPSESTAISRRILFKSTVNFTLRIGTAATPAGLADGTSVWEYGLRDAFQSFPLQKLITTMTCSINNTSVSINMQDVLPALLQLVDKRVLQEYHGSTPSYLDTYESFAQAAGAEVNNPLGNYKLSGFDDLLMPRGSHPITIRSVVKAGTAGAGGNGDNLISADADNYWVIQCSAEFTEPLCISPMIFGDASCNQAAFLGVNNFNLTANIDSTMKRFWSTGFGAPPYTIEFDPVTPFSNPYIIMEFMSLDATFAVPTQLCLPFMDYPRYITGGAGALAAGDTRTSAINSLQLDKVPDKILVFVRRPITDSTVKTSDSFLPISRVNITFNNASGLLSTYTQQQLWRLSRKNGCKQSWSEWSGFAQQLPEPGATPYTSAQANVANVVSTCGGVMVIDPSLDLSLQQPYLTDGSQGQFQLQMELTYKNHSADAINPEIVVVIFNAGLISTVAGNSQLHTGLADMKTVMSVIEKDAGKADSIYGEGDRLVGAARSAGAHSGGAYPSRPAPSRHSRLSGLVM